MPSSVRHFPPDRYAVRAMTWTTSAQDVLRYYGASVLGSGPQADGMRSPRESFNPEAEDFKRIRGSYQEPVPHP